MICSRCGSDNQPQAAFCLNCGLSFAPGALAQTQKLRKGMAIASLVLGIVSLLTCSLFIVGAIAGIALGIAAFAKSSRSPLEYGGKGMAIAGIALSGTSFIVGIIAAIAIPNLIRSRQVAYETSAMLTLKTLSQAEALYFSAKGKYGSLEDLYQSGYIGNDMASGSKPGYRFEIRLKKTGFEAVAVPLTAGTFGTGTKSFYVSSPDLVIRQSDGGREATASDPPVY